MAHSPCTCSRPRKRNCRLTAFASFYLFVFPALVASHTWSPNRYALVFGVFLYFQLWMLTTEWAYRSAASLYKFRREYLWPFPYVRRHTKRMASGFETVFSCVFSYFFTVYGFALAYTFLSSSDPKAFNVGELGIFSGAYFSIVTAATVGYGDIVPLSVTARSLVMVEIVVSLLYAVFLFSVLASAVRDGNVTASRDPRNAPDEERQDEASSPPQ